MPSDEHVLREAQAVARAEVMLGLAEVTGIDVEALAFVAGRFERCLGVLDAAEPVRRAELDRLMSEDFDELATAYKVLSRAVEQGGEA